MGVPQMYYTSCESGLAGYAGFQFNAATPGVDSAVLRRVEQATSYEPPRSLGYEPTTDEIAATPVNLCYLPGTDGEPAILANTVFVGNDYSQRFGNYFVHALSLTSPEHDLGGARPIDFWHASFWARTEARRPELPELDPVPAAVFGPEEIEEFLRRNGRLGVLPRLLSAVERSIVSGDRPVIIVAEESELVAHWVATICRLLPPALVGRFSFATYQYRPGRGREHLVGTTPTTDFAVTESALRSFAVFDLVGGNESASEAHPLAELLTAAGPEDARTVWELAEPLASGNERDFTGWYPVAVAGALCAKLPVNVGDLAAFLDWLPGNADRLGPATVSQLAEYCLDHEGLTLPQCLRLVGVAAGTRDESLHAAAEVRAFEMLLRDPAAAPADVPPLVTAAGIRYAAEQVTTRLDGAAPGSDTVAVLALAARTRLPLPESDLEAYGRDLIAPLLLDDPEARPPGVLRTVPALRRGLLRGLADALSARERDVLAAASRLAGIVPDAEFAAHPPMQRMLELVRAADDPGRKIPALKRLCATTPPDRATLATLWPRGWRLDEAAQVVSEVPERFWASAALVDLLDQVLARPELPRDGWPQYLKLSSFVVKQKLTGKLSLLSRDRVLALEHSRDLVQQAETTSGDKQRDATRKVIEYHDRIDPPAQIWLGLQLPAILLRLDAKALAESLPRTPSEIRRRYRDRLTDTLRQRSGDLGIAATAFEAMHLLSGKQPEHARKIEEVLNATVARWKPRDLDALEKLFSQSSVRGLAEHFTEWREAKVPRGIGRFLPRRR